eukprot:5422532-Pyramimonas_sp.AAC.2
MDRCTFTDNVAFGKDGAGAMTITLAEASSDVESLRAFYTTALTVTNRGTHLRACLVVGTLLPPDPTVNPPHPTVNPRRAR